MKKRNVPWRRLLAVLTSLLMMPRARLRKLLQAAGALSAAPQLKISWLRIYRRAQCAMKRFQL